jgi:hypothetical protein
MVPPIPSGPALLPDWIALCTEKPMEPLIEIFDPHQHFFTFGKASFGDQVSWGCSLVAVTAWAQL